MTHLTATEQDALASVVYWAAQCMWWARHLPDTFAAITLGRCLERMEVRARALPPEYRERARQLNDAIECAARLPRASGTITVSPRCCS